METSNAKTMNLKAIRSLEREAWNSGDEELAAVTYTIARRIEKLTEAARQLSRNMERLARDLEANGADACVNSLGEVQIAGLEVDRECALFDVARSTLRDAIKRRGNRTTTERPSEPAANTRQQAATPAAQASDEGKHYVHDRKGRRIRVTIPE